MTSILIHAWTIHYDGENYYLPYTHWVYLNEIVKYYDTVTLLSPIIKKLESLDCSLESIKCFKQVKIVSLPPSSNYIGAIKNFFSYRKAYSKMQDYDVMYARYPTPFGWLQKVYGKNSKRIIHYVGDPIDATNNNPNFGKIKKKILVNLFKPENALYNWACKGANVFTNGYHISERLAKRNITATPLISSTLVEADFYLSKSEAFGNTAPKILYVGYLRKAKGVETVLKAFGLLQNRYPKAKLTIVGAGESERELKQMVVNNKTTFVSFLGHIDDRNQLNEILRNHDVFCFASLSEGSPRVILEAMANGINVVSTPVGSLPHVFEDNKDILFADFNNAEMFCEKMTKLLENQELTYKLRLNAFNKTKEFTIQSFLKKIFYEA
ncbi:glycosyltransferase family 4 protein [Nonlabens agnitus]|uniref:Glycosyl transferase family 1 domain-containing protein n=1 Tax=Nonlabens agnitus TaxID=870484 RepID=A0A2S9WTW2_9FLAO|nr:glycosyltransferase family 4 protein [Nonlabens agnitus]PRP66922.1 hypothetical protein BST86_07330 [Nonlabens agnitus]